MTSTTTSVDILDRWFSSSKEGVANHTLLILVEDISVRDQEIPELQKIMRGHYAAPEMMAKWLSDLGASDTATFFSEKVPINPRGRSGDFGEILATEVAERKLGFVVPVRKLRFKDGRNSALRGDDLIGISRDIAGRLTFLKGEAKSRLQLDSTTVAKAGEALDRDNGHPDRHSIVFIAERLRDQGDDSLALELVKTLLASFKGSLIEHFLFTVSGNNPSSILRVHLSAFPIPIRRNAVGVHVSGHAALIERLFKGL